ncbi:MAG: hypothetical protein M3Y18_00860 [Candidatus Eremiobacteraeota bacterium]|nr:hypothetical protein [Candidatus Eremiobacteraeota bacterium]
MNDDSDDQLDRALFALPLEEAPADLRQTILATTIYRPAPPFALWEAWTLGVAVAVMAWLIVEIVLGGGARFIASFEYLGALALQAVAQPATLLWIAIGTGASVWFSHPSLALPVPERARREP